MRDVLLLPMQGYREFTNSEVNGDGVGGRYWSSSYDSRMYFNSTSISPHYGGVSAYGFSVRCFRDATPPSGTLSYSPNTTTTGSVVVTLTTSRPVHVTSAGWIQIDTLRYIKTYIKNVTLEPVYFNDGYGLTGAAFVLINWIQMDPNAFVTTWETLSPLEVITLPVTGANYNVDITW